MVLIGEDTSKRSVYLKKAAEQLGVSFQEISWSMMNREFDFGQLQGKGIKIDPPSYEAVHLCHMEELLRNYRHQLAVLSSVQGSFLNHPQAIAGLLDKKQSKLYLQSKGLPVTKMFSETIESKEQLLWLMKEERCYSVFVKPRYFSGAAGVAAVRMNPVKEELLVYTSCKYKDKELVNTKKLSLLRDEKEITILLDKLLMLDCVVERWHPKSVFHGMGYDLRVVYQFGHIAYMVVRQSHGPISNLHLNNQALPVEVLGLERKKIQEIEELCESATKLFSGLNMAGIDVMLDKSTLRPRIIEMNGQGDLIYQDIFNENSIYREQIQVYKNQGNFG